MRSVHQFPTRPPCPAGKVSPLVLVLVLCVLTLAVGAFWYYRAASAHNKTSDASASAIHLSDSTREALKHLNSPLEIRFYSLLGETSCPASLRAFSGRVDQLLTAYRRESGSNITVTRCFSREEGDLAAASSAGITVFNLDKGEPSYLGLSVAQEDQKEVLPRITPEWEQALEADLTRAILRVSGPRSLAARTEAAVKADSGAVEEVKRVVPDLDAVPVDQGRQILREGALKELRAAATEMQTQIAEAQQRLREAQATQSKAAQEAAMKQLQQAQATQTEMLKEISARLEAQITALERLKGEPPSTR